MDSIRQHVTVVPADNLILVNGQGLTVPCSAPPALHTLQWHGGQGHCEWTNAANTPLALDDYPEHVAPYVTLWEAEQSRISAETRAAEVARIATYNSVEARAGRLRAERDKRLAATDYLMVADYPLAEAQREPWRVYRQTLRDITTLSGFPWQGGDSTDSACPWPVLPA